MTDLTNRKNPWKTLKSAKVYENNWIKLSHNDVITPRNQEGIYGVVHFKNRAVGIVPYEDGNIWLVGQYRYALNAYSWEIPEGGSPFGEAIEDSALRELEEETGITAKTLTPLFDIHLSNSVTDEWGRVFLATDLTQGDSMPEHTEDISVRKISLTNFYDEVESGEITDSLTVAACYKLMLMKARGEL